jgi:hypothetical protein
MHRHGPSLATLSLPLISTRRMHLGNPARMSTQGVAWPLIACAPSIQQRRSTERSMVFLEIGRPF